MGSHCPSFARRAERVRVVAIPMGSPSSRARCTDALASDEERHRIRRDVDAGLAVLGPARCPSGRGDGTNGSQATGFLEAHVSAVTHDDVVKNLNPKQGASRHQPARQVAIVGAGCRVATGVSVRQDDTRGVRQNRRAKDLAGLCSGDGYVVQSLGSQGRASLTVHGRNIFSPVLSSATHPAGTSR